MRLCSFLALENASILIIHVTLQWITTHSVTEHVIARFDSSFWSVWRYDVLVPSHDRHVACVCTGAKALSLVASSASMKVGHTLGIGSRRALQLILAQISSADIRSNIFWLLSVSYDNCLRVCTQTHTPTQKSTFARKYLCMCVFSSACSMKILLYMGHTHTHTHFETARQMLTNLMLLHMFWDMELSHSFSAWKFNVSTWGIACACQLNRNYLIFRYGLWYSLSSLQMTISSPHAMSACLFLKICDICTRQGSEHAPLTHIQNLTYTGKGSTLLQMPVSWFLSILWEMPCLHSCVYMSNMKTMSCWPDLSWPGGLQLSQYWL